MASDTIVPYLSLCLIHRSNRDTLPKLYDSIRGIFDELILVDTGSDDGSRDLSVAFLDSERSSGTTGKVLDFVWCDDFAKARQFSFEAATGRWRMFLDADDQLVNGDRIREFLLNVEGQHPGVEAGFVDYDYDHLERLPTMRLVRWRPGWRWTDAIHERLEFRDNALPEEAFCRNDAFEVKHKPKTQEEKTAAIRRNARIAEKELTSTADERYAARLKRTTSMELKMDGKAAETIPLLEPLYRYYRTYPEGRQAAADISKAYQHLAETAPTGKSENLDLALGWAKKAGPAYEALVHQGRGEYRECLRAAQRSLGRGQQTTHEGLLFEQGAVYIAAAVSALQLPDLERPADVVENILNHIPDAIRNDPTIGPHVNALRGAVDRITILVPGTPQPFDEHGGGGMLGGSEEAVMYLSRALAELGRNVRVFGVLPPHRLPGPDQYGVDWQPVTAFDPNREQGTLVVWRSPGTVLNMMRAAGARGRPPSGVAQAFLWLHDSGLGVSPEMAKVAGQGVKGAVVLSEFHGRMIRSNGYVGQLVKLSNGIVEEDFEPFIDLPEFGFAPESGLDDYRDPNRVVYSSCPSRGLGQLLKMWPEVKAACPRAYLDIYYDWSMLEGAQPRLFEEITAAYEAVQHLDVKHHGGVSHQELHDALCGANVWAYSHFESPLVETSCISAMKATACGATVLTVPNGALPETVPDARFERSASTYQSALIELLRTPESVEVRRSRARQVLKRFGWRTVAKDFSAVWSLHSRLVPNAIGSDPKRLVEGAEAVTV